MMIPLNIKVLLSLSALYPYGGKQYLLRITTLGICTAVKHSKPIVKVTSTSMRNFYRFSENFIL